MYQWGNVSASNPQQTVVQRLLEENRPIRFEIHTARARSTLVDEFISFGGNDDVTIATTKQRQFYTYFYLYVFILLNNFRFLSKLRGEVSF